MKQSVRILVILFCLLLLALQLGDKRALATDDVVRPTARGLVVEPLDEVAQLAVEDSNFSEFPVEPDGTVRVIVELKGLPVVAAQAAARAEIALDSAEADRVRIAIAEEQNTFLEQAFGLVDGISADYHYDTVLNGLSIRVAKEDLTAISKIAGVKTLFPDQRYELHLDASLEQINAQDAWFLNGPITQGQGMKVAVIDSGIEPNHPLFNGAGYVMPVGYPKGNCVYDSVNFCNGKIIVARWYGENGGVPAGAIPQEVASPLDRTGHGSHVAGIAIGNRGLNGGLPATVGDGITSFVSGVAPAAHLMVYKACWNGASCQVSGLIAALEDAVLDGADVINNSWGGPAGEDPADSPFTTAVKNAIAAGVPVVFSAGNFGNQPGTISCPACVAETIAVGNVSTNRRHAHRVTLNDGTPPTTRFALAAEETPSNTQLPSRAVFLAENILSGNETACAPFGGTFVGGPIILADRGGCGFATKVNNAAAAGASMLLLVNNQQGPPPRISVSGATQIPTLIFAQDDGNMMRDAIRNQAGATLAVGVRERVSDNRWDNIVAGGSSRGPSGDLNTLKPDLVAPGNPILSASTYGFGGNGWAFDSGTSMAAPHVTGAIALLLQRNPSWTPAQVKSAVISSASPIGLLKDDATTAADAFDVGAGQLDADALFDVAVTFAEASYANPACLIRCEWENTITNESAEMVTWAPAILAPNNLSIRVVPASVTLAPGESRAIAVSIEVTDGPYGVWHHATLLWSQNNENVSTLTHRQPIAIRAEEGYENAVFEKSAETPPELSIGDTFTYTLAVNNPSSTPASFDITDTLPPEVTYISSNGSYDAQTRTVTGNSGLLQPALSLSTGDFQLGGYIELLDLRPDLEPFACTGSCDDSWFVIPNLDIKFLGKSYSQIYASSNGFIGLQPPTNNSNVPQNMPDQVSPNHIIAPLWTDYDLLGTDGDTIGQGKMYGALVTDPNTNTVWYVIEWKDVAQFGAPEIVHSFQIWINRNDNSEMWFAYGRLDGLHSSNRIGAAIGVEGPDGVIGSSYFYKATLGSPGLGVEPSTTQEVLLTSRAPFELQVVVRADSGLVIENEATATSNGVTWWAEHRQPIGKQTYLPFVTR